MGVFPCGKCGEPWFSFDAGASHVCNALKVQHLEKERDAALLQNDVLGKQLSVQLGQIQALELSLESRNKRDEQMAHGVPVEKYRGLLQSHASLCGKIEELNDKLRQSDLQIRDYRSVVSLVVDDLTVAQELGDRSLKVNCAIRMLKEVLASTEKRVGPDPKCGEYLKSTTDGVTYDRCGLMEGHERDCSR